MVEDLFGEDYESFKHKYLDWFHKNCVFNNKWLGRPALKTPFDSWVYQEIIYDTKPNIIIEIGNFAGGSTLYLANIFDSLGYGKVIGVDIDHNKVSDLNHKRIKWITGDATNSETLDKVRNEINVNDRVMIIEDSSHKYESTLSILEHYSSLVTVGCYFIIEDGICKENYIDGPKPGPFEATHKFLSTHPEFQIDKKMEKFFFTYNPDGFLKKIKYP